MADRQNEQQSRFNVMVNQLVTAVGPDAQTEILRRTLTPLNFVQMKIAKSEKDVDPASQFLVAVVDFTNMPVVQTLAKFITSVSSNFSGVSVIYAINPVSLTEKELLLGVELGIKRVFFGPRRDEELRSFIKQQAIAVTENGSMAFVEAEVLKNLKKGEAALKLQSEKLAAMDKDSDDVNRLQAMVFEARGDLRRMEFHLKQTLKSNPQNLWAANKLGQFYLANKRVAEGIEILKKLSRFHEMNSERMLVLGDAYLNCGKTQEADQALTKGNELTGGGDARFAEGLAKVDLLKGDMASALRRVGKKYLSAPVLAFLNTRAVMAVRSGQAESGLKLYQEAVEGCDPEQKVIAAKIYFNMGLAFTRAHKIPEGVKAFEKSIQEGGAEFNRAEKPLAIAKVIAAKKPGSSPSELASSQQSIEELEFETFK
jgi:tetratricopeptide (TPR) repeat protein